MALTPAQRKVLERYQLFRYTPPTIWRLWMLNSRNQAIMAIMIPLACIYFYLEAAPSTGWFCAGLGFGTILRDFGWHRNTTRVWPVMSHVIDWQKIDNLLEGRADLESES